MVAPERAHIEGTIRAFLDALQSYDFDRLAKVVDPRGSWIEGGPEVPLGTFVDLFRQYQEKQIQVRFGDIPALPINAVEGAAWVTFQGDGTMTARTDGGREFLRGIFKTDDLEQEEWRGTFVVTHILRQEPDGSWRIVVHHVTDIL